MGRVIALDYGRSRVGVALSDESQSLSFPKPYVLLAQREDLVKLIRDEGVEQILVGLPKNLRGEEREIAAEARQFGEYLGGQTGIAVEYVDERFTTLEAKRRLSEAGQQGVRKQRGQQDSVAAHILLEQYLQNHKKLNKMT
ncbi:MAG: hypothetical protein A3K06_00365 [Candidatus Doudnabacteria bacterium RIFCSPHIGHO2_01_52_17]|uniref:Putative pre-16S rRNA nuclease n=1 Tax=Candidatus Doudnabacteria bacterium RIFCSPHIGHO2_01_52_17 TaxID=1817820 RepID=A0A1F5NDG1_9BACT|nr:MAG: hypothetical protein A3K06_00365 [Candidatus Doudnabacteria bacterium RIFCSPHIGHO2_01_52_17]